MASYLAMFFLVNICLVSFNFIYFNEKLKNKTNQKKTRHSERQGLGNIISKKGNKEENTLCCDFCIHEGITHRRENPIT